MIEEDGTIRLQPCVSPVWDTAITTIALADARAARDHPALLRAVRWLLEKEVRRAGDWASAGGRRAERLALPVSQRALSRTSTTRRWSCSPSSAPPSPIDPEVQAATQRGVDWLLAMQNRDGGWAALRRRHRQRGPHQASRSPTTTRCSTRAAPTSRRGSSSCSARSATAPTTRRSPRASTYLWRTQEPEGCWYGRWGVNYIYGTWQVLQGLEALDFPMDHPARRRGRRLARIGPAGGRRLGRDLRELRRPVAEGAGRADRLADRLGRARPDRRRPRRVRGRPPGHRLPPQDTQRADGTWDEDHYTGTGFPRVFYLKYHLYRVYFPLMAIAAISRAPARRDCPPRHAGQIKTVLAVLDRGSLSPRRASHGCERGGFRQTGPRQERRGHAISPRR